MLRNRGWIHISSVSCRSIGEATILSKSTHNQSSIVCIFNIGLLYYTVISKMGKGNVFIVVVLLEVSYDASIRVLILHPSYFFFLGSISTRNLLFLHSYNNQKSSPRKKYLYYLFIILLTKQTNKHINHKKINQQKNLVYFL